jgi:hypothetical protein
VVTIDLQEDAVAIQEMLANAIRNEEVSVVLHDGTTRTCGDEELTETVGNFLVAMLLQARTKGVFADLPKADRCELGVEDPTTGAFGWRNYDDRGKSNLVA